MHFPAALTEEEELLKQTLARLKKKKKQLQSLKAAAQSQEKETTLSKSANKSVPAPSLDSADKATEQAKKLVQSGAITVRSQKEKFGFKRSKNFEKKKDSDKPTGPVGFQPFMSFAGEEEEEKQPPVKKMKGLSESFVSAGYNNRGYEREHRDPPKKGQTLFVKGQGITKEIIQKSFSNFGNILNINMEPEKQTAFVTFEKVEQAEQAIVGVAGGLTNNIHLHVEMARRQPVYEPPVEGASQSSWSSIAANTSQKGASCKDSREVVKYEEEDLF
ncbi:negative elongation factor E [Biomphalaria pfeifferi]|uniref:Negative elongation factor E n=1 Tax=Biomphalaria pfeifferi TaxID=112525 RepID=A0AAD8AU66_BIOPF|nr:negative elongation factor E [Biomphalaria pfeifferi]